MAATGTMRALDVLGITERSPAAAALPVLMRVCVPHLPIINWYARFLTGPQVKPLTPLEKAHLAAHNVIDPFNLITIAASRRFLSPPTPTPHTGPACGAIAVT